MVASNTGADPVPQEDQAMQAYASYWNSQGGYKGHRIVVDAIDAQVDPTQTADAARQLIGQDHVLAMIANSYLTRLRRAGKT